MLFINGNIKLLGITSIALSIITHIIKAVQRFNQSSMLKTCKHWRISAKKTLPRALSSRCKIIDSHGAFVSVNNVKSAFLIKQSGLL